MSSKVMVKRLSVVNFLSLSNVEVDFGKLTLLVGLNASGKSNIVKALALLGMNGRTRGGVTLQAVARDQLGMESLEQLFQDQGHELAIRIHSEIGDENLFYALSFDSRGLVTGEQMEYGGEKLLVRTWEERFKYKRKEAVGLVEAQIPRDYPLLYFAVHDPHPLFENAKDHLGGIRTYSFDSDSIRGQSSTGFELSLARNGSNLAQVLHTLLTSERERFIQTEEVMKELIPEIEEINVPATQDGTKTYISIKEKAIPKPLKYQNISDGTLRILAFVTALHLGGTLIAFEEPENCVHPYLFETLVDLCRKAPVQVVITTHSPSLVSKASPQELLLVEKKDGATRVSHVDDIGRVRKLLEEGLSLGEIWYMDQLQK